MSVCIRYMAGTITVCLSDQRLHVQVRVHEAGVGAGASASCQGLTLLLSSPPLPPTSSRKRFRPNCVPALSTVVPPPTPARLPTCCAPARFRTRALPKSPTPSKTRKRTKTWPACNSRALHPYLSLSPFYY